MSTDPKLRVAKVLVTDSAGNILLLRRSDTHPYYAHHWDFPGGEVEDGENTNVAAKRELEEETGISIEVSQLQVAFEKDTKQNRIHALFTVTMEEFTPPVTISWEHDTYTWLPVEEILKLEIPEHADDYYIEVVEWLADTNQTS